MKTVVLLSGGVDSTVLLAACCADGDTVLPVTFDYGQTHRREIQAAHAVADHYRVSTTVVQLPDIFGVSALLGDCVIPDEHAERPDVTTVPGRNLVMLTVAAAVAARGGAGAVLVGANADDAAGYLDCRQVFIQAMDHAVSLGTGGVGIHAPFLSWSKARIIDYGRKLGVPLGLTWSCYRGGEVPCHTCVVRVSVVRRR